jgi:hypothetical protein
MMGKFVIIEIYDEDEINVRSQFDIELSKVIDGLDAMGQDFTLLDNSESVTSIIRFTVNKVKSIDEDESSNSGAYAV